MIAQILLSIALIIVGFGLKDIWRLARALTQPLFSPLRNLRSPPSHGFFEGNAREFSDDPVIIHEKWVETYGPVFNFKMQMNTDRLYIADARAAAHIVNNLDYYPKPYEIMFIVKRMFGAGILAVEGTDHKRQRHVMTPAFGGPSVREITPIFFDKATQLKDIWSKKLREAADDSKVTINVAAWLNRLTLDIIGLAGFDYHFDALDEDGKPNELNEAIQSMFNGENPRGLLDFIHAMLPFTEIIPSRYQQALRRSRSIMDRIGYELINRVKEDVRASAGDNINRDDFENRDILSLTVRANMANDLPDNSRLSDEEMLAQIPTFLVAGHETSSRSLTFILLCLATHPAVQDTLRAELQACGQLHGDRPSMEALDDLPYLDAVVRETLRLYPPVGAPTRVAAKNDVIPTDCIWEDKHGARHTGVPVAPGDTIIIPIAGLNRLKEIWGPDANEFKPERWASPPEAANAIPGIWKNHMTFSGGGRGCIGYRFSIIETKAIIFTLVSSFRFDMAVDPDEIIFRSGDMLRTLIKSRLGEGPQLPLVISAI